MYEKVNPSHPDKVADRIAGAIVDLCYRVDARPRAAIEVLIGHRRLAVLGECSIRLASFEDEILDRISKITPEPIESGFLTIMKQDLFLSRNQETHSRCGDNGIFKGVPVTEEQRFLTDMAKVLYEEYPTDGKYLLNGMKVTICQSYADSREILKKHPGSIVNPLGDWTGGLDVDTGATNRKLGSDMGNAMTGGGLHGKDLSKADVSANIWCHLRAQETGCIVEACCNIGDEKVNVLIHGEETKAKQESVKFSDMISVAHEYIDSIGGFEKFAEWGLIR